MGTKEHHLSFNPKADAPKTFRATLKPADADFILEHHNPLNRSLRPGVAEQYGREMTAGAWRVTNQGIGFDRNGALVDGQHRLFAGSSAGANVAFDTMVTVGLDPRAREVIDSGLKRTAGDLFAWRNDGARVSHLFVGIARAMYSPTGNSAQRQTNSELLDWLARHHDAIEFVVSRTTATLRGVATASVLAVVARAWYTENHEELEKFLAVLMSGHADATNEPGSKTVVALRNTLAREGSNSGNRVENYGKTARALKAFLDRQALPKIYAASSELFPIPKARK